MGDRLPQKLAFPAPHPVIPAQAGISGGHAAPSSPEMPAFAGMTHAETESTIHG